MTETRPRDVASAEWLKYHGIQFSRLPGLYESATAWVTVNEAGDICSAGERVVIEGKYGEAGASTPSEDDRTGEGCVAVFEKIQRSVRTMRLLPRVAVRSRFCNWPDTIQNFYDAYGYTPGRIKVVPTARQLDEMDQVIRWMTWLSRALGPDYMRIVWARADRRSWRQIAHIVGLSHTTCRERFRTGVAAIYVGLIKNTLQ